MAAKANGKKTRLTFIAIAGIAVALYLVTAIWPGLIPEMANRVILLVLLAVAFYLLGKSVKNLRR